MKKQTNILLLAALGISLVVFFLYAAMRSDQTSRIQQQLNALKAKEVRFGTTVEDVELLKKKFPAQPDISSFVEKLYDSAKNTGVENVEISTANISAPKAARKTAAGKDTASLLASYPIRIACEGKYLAIAHYFKQIQDIPRYSKIVSISMKPDKHSIKTTIIVEIVSFEVPNAS